MTDHDLNRRIVAAIDQQMSGQGPGDAVDNAQLVDDRARLREIARAHLPETQMGGAVEGHVTPRCAVDGEDWPCTELRTAAADLGLDVPGH